MILTFTVPFKTNFKVIAFARLFKKRNLQQKLNTYFLNDVLMDSRPIKPYGAKIQFYIFCLLFL